MKYKIAAAVLICVAFAGGVMFERSRANACSRFESQLSALIPVGEYYRASAPVDSAERMNHIYHLAILNLATAENFRSADIHDERLPRILSVIKIGRERAGLPPFEPNHFSPPVGAETLRRIQEILK